MSRLICRRKDVDCAIRERSASTEGSSYKSKSDLQHHAIVVLSKDIKNDPAKSVTICMD